MRVCRCARARGVLSLDERELAYVPDASYIAVAVRVWGNHTTHAMSRLER